MRQPTSTTKELRKLPDRFKEGTGYLWTANFHDKGIEKTARQIQRRYRVLMDTRQRN